MRKGSGLFKALKVLWIAAGLALAMCTSDGGGPVGEYESMDFETFVDGKEDTGYVSNKAAELEATLSSRVYIDQTGRTPEEIAQFAESLRTASRWTLEDHTSPQIKYGRNALKSEKLDLNLERGEPTILDVQTAESGVWLSFSLAIESLVKFKDLEEQGLTPADLVGKQINFLLPAVPAAVFTKGGAACATDPDGGELDPSELTEENFFYYYDPVKEGCPLVHGTDLVDAVYTITSSLDTTSVYPEYDLLTQDKKITMTALFGQITHGDLTDGDWGWIAYRQFLGYFTSAGFTRSQTFENNFGEQIRKTYAGGLEVIVDFYTPEALKDHRPRDEVNALFMDVIKNHEIVYYNGHSFYGSLSVLDNPEAYPDQTYQIIFMDSCWSYAYYTKQVFESKSTEDDPDGMKWADVVNNTEPGITGSHQTAFVLYKNIFEGASKFMQEVAPVKYSWNNLIVYMNDDAERRARWYDPDKFHAEIYGASGVSKNCFNPSGPSYCDDGGGTSLTHTYDGPGGVPIPDNDPAGASTSLNVTDSYAMQSLSLTVDISHTYIGDLTVSLSHGGRDVVLHNREGGGSDDIRTTFIVQGMAGLDASGDWTLKVTDGAGYDTGTINSWSLTVTEASDNPTIISGENNEPLAVPDEQQTGVTSAITIAEDVVASEVIVHVKITHTYIGDLVIVLRHGGREEPLWIREGGSADNMDKDFYPTQFNGQSAAGEWTLTVADEVGGDTGTLDSWNITILPAATP